MDCDFELIEKSLVMSGSGCGAVSKEALPCLSAPERCVSRVGTIEVLD